MSMSKGAVYMIRNMTLSGKPVEEGKARLVKHVSDIPGSGGDETWMVEFLNEPGATYRRNVLGNDMIQDASK